MQQEITQAIFLRKQNGTQGWTLDSRLVRMQGHYSIAFCTHTLHAHALLNSVRKKDSTILILKTQASNGKFLSYFSMALQRGITNIRNFSRKQKFDQASFMKLPPKCAFLGLRQPGEKIQHELKHTNTDDFKQSPVSNQSV